MVLMSIVFRFAERTKRITIAIYFYRSVDFRWIPIKRYRATCRRPTGRIFNIFVSASFFSNAYRDRPRTTLKTRGRCFIDDNDLCPGEQVW